MKQSKPIHAINKDQATHLIGKCVLCAQHKEGLGYYGTLVGFCQKTGKFIVKRDCDKNNTLWMWIVEDAIRNDTSIDSSANIINEIDEVVI